MWHPSSVKRILLPLVVSAAMLSMVACGGGSDEAKTPAPAPAGETPTAGAGMTQADFAAKVPAALKKKSTFQAVVTTTDEDGPSLVTSDVMITDTGTDLSAVSDQGLDVVREYGKYYGKGEGLTQSPAKPWKTWDPMATSADPMYSLTGVQLKLQSAPALTHQLLAGVAYATKFSSASAAEVDGDPVTQYTITIDAPKAAAARALGELLTSEVVAAQKITEITATVLIDEQYLPRELDFTAGTSKVAAKFGSFGDPVRISPPDEGQIDS